MSSLTIRIEWWRENPLQKLTPYFAHVLGLMAYLGHKNNAPLSRLTSDEPDESGPDHELRAFGTPNHRNSGPQLPFTGAKRAQDRWLRRDSQSKTILWLLWLRFLIAPPPLLGPKPAGCRNLGSRFFGFLGFFGCWIFSPSHLQFHPFLPYSLHRHLLHHSYPHTTFLNQTSFFLFILPIFLSRNDFHNHLNH